MEPFAYRAARKRDVGSIEELAEDCGISFWGADAYIKEIDAPDSIILVATGPGDVLVGFLHLRLLSVDLSDGNSLQNRQFSELEILNIAVNKNYRRKSIAGKLIDLAIDDKRSALPLKVFLEVRESNHPALRFYESIGFKTTGLRKAYYAGPTENAVLMELYLD